MVALPKVVLWRLASVRSAKHLQDVGRLLKNCYPLDGKLGIGDLTPLQCRYDFGRQTLVGTAEGSTVSFKFVTFSFELNK